LDAVVTSVILRPALARSRSAVIGGVCAGVARHLGWSAAATRWLAVLLSVCGGGGVLLYAWLWALAPLESTDEPPAVTRLVPVAMILDALATMLALVVVVAGHPSAALLVIVALLAVTAVVWSLGFDRGDPSRHPRYVTFARGWALAVLVGAGAAVLAVNPSVSRAIVAVGMIVIGAAGFAAPRILALWTDLLTERATRVRQEQRAEIAAHLHDSVLQTLALIQNRAGASSEVARIARAQERELRDWLFDGDVVTPVDLATELREVAEAMELDHPVRIEFVTAGDSAGHSSPALVAAAREALLNAARHAGGEVSVYLESSPTATDVFVRDRGPGVDLAALPVDRLGIRESIVGRMARAGGAATVRPGVGGLGTEVHLHLEAVDD
jgi:signal transduction histidine kinase